MDILAYSLVVTVPIADLCLCQFKKYFKFPVIISQQHLLQDW